MEAEMLEIQSSEAKTHLPSLLDKVERGETIRITRHGKAIARIVPEENERRKGIGEALDNIKKLGKKVGARNKDLTIEEIISSIHEGHKY
jgi:prevent-host-death family protein